MGTVLISIMLGCILSQATYLQSCQVGKAFNGILPVFDTDVKTVLQYEQLYAGSELTLVHLGCELHTVDLRLEDC